MITKVTSNTANEYNRLFRQAEKALNADGSSDISIDSLNAYFTHIAELGSEAIDDPRFIMLPLDEEPIVIDANTRKCDVPRAYMTGGLGVTDDHLAEIVFFKIDRYFDHTDLATQDIQIEWRNLASKEAGVISAWPRDIVSEPNYLIFGWVLTSAMTATPGKIQFAVRFFTKNNDEVVYSFSTQPADILINKGIELSDEEITNELASDEVKRMITGRLISSQPDTTPTPIPEPKFLQDVPMEAAVYNLNDNDAANSPNDNNYTLYIEAVCVTGKIKYILRKQDKTTQGWVEITDNDIAEIMQKYWVITKDDEPKESKVYYLREPGNGLLPDTYAPHDLSEDEKNNFVEARKNLYECICKIDIKRAGKYQVKARATSGASQSEALSGIIEFPYPQTPVLTSEQQSVILDGDNVLLTPIYATSAPNDQGDLSYKWSCNNSVLENENESTLNITAPGNYGLIVTNSLNNEQVESNQLNYRATYPADELEYDTNSEAWNSREENSLRFTITSAADKFDEIEGYWCTISRGEATKIDGTEFSATNNEPLTFEYTPTQAVSGFGVKFVVKLNGTTYNQEILGWNG